jgi:hypothetical protein
MKVAHGGDLFGPQIDQREIDHLVGRLERLAEAR